MRKIRFIPLAIFLLCTVLVQAQTIITPQVDMADRMRSNGKIYVVVGVLVIILFGLFTYLVSIDKKVSRVEKSIQDKNK